MHPKGFDPRDGRTAWCSAACVLIPSQVYARLGGFDEDFFMYCEDVDLSWRVRAAGYHCFSVASAWFHHYAVDRDSRRAEMLRSAYILGHKWRAHGFTQRALSMLASVTDIERKAFEDEVQRMARRPMDVIHRAQPDFGHEMVFAEPMWT